MSIESDLEEIVRRVLREELRGVLKEIGPVAAERRVSRTEAAAAAGVSPATIKAWATSGRLREFGKGRGVRYSIAEVLAVRPDDDASISANDWAESKLGALK